MSDLPEGVKIEMQALNDLMPDADNVNRQTKRSRDAIARSLKRFGAGRSIVLDGQGVVRAGNGTIEQAVDQGMQKVVVVETDGSTLVAVKRSDWSADEATAYAIADNRAAQHSEWDYEGLAGQMRELNDAGYDLEDVGFAEYEYDPLLRADWTPPEKKERTDAESKDEKTGAMPVRVSIEQRERFMIALYILRNESGEYDMSEGVGLAQLAERFLATRTPEEIEAADAGRLGQDEDE